MAINLQMNLTYNLTKCVYRIYSYVKPGKNVIDIENSINKRCKIKKGRSHTEIWACTWQIEDTESALRNFEKYGISGPTKYRDIDESYLRLFGFFASVFMQKDAVIELNEIFTTRRLGDVKKLFKENKLVKLRNRLASHNVSNNFDLQRTSITTQSSLSFNDFQVSFVAEKAYSINLLDELEHFRELVNSELLLLAKLMLKRFNTISEERKIILSEQLHLLERWMEGDKLMHNIDGTIIVLSSDLKYLKSEEE